MDARAQAQKKEAQGIQPLGLPFISLSYNMPSKATFRVKIGRQQ